MIFWHRPQSSGKLLTEPPFRVGIYADPDLPTAKKIRDIGIDAIFLPETSTTTAYARNIGLSTFIHIWTFSVPRRTLEYGLVDCFGHARFWANSGCPNNPAVQRYALKRIETIARRNDIDGIILDGVRFPSPGSGGRPFSGCFCSHCIELATKIGYDVELMKVSIKRLIRGELSQRLPLEELGYAGINQWLSLRSQSITRFIAQVNRLVKGISRRIILSAALFSPSLAPLVGQDLASLEDIIDLPQLMVYHKGQGPACVNYESFKFAQLVSPTPKLQRRTIEGLIGLKPRPNLVRRGFEADLVRIELKKASKLLRNFRETLPILYILNSDRREIARLTKTALGAGPVSLAYFAYTRKNHNALRTSPWRQPSVRRYAT